MQPKFKLNGYRPSAIEINCKKLSVKAATFEKMAADTNTTHIIPEYTPISNQLSLSSCVGNACGDALELLKGIENPNKVEQISRLFIYYNARNIIRETDKDEGCYIHDALNSLKTLGTCRETIWKYDINEVFTKPSIESYREGNDNTITEFYQINSSSAQRLKDIEVALRANHPVIFGSQVGSEFVNYDAGRDGGNKVFGVPSDDVGGHAILITGIRTNKDNQKEFLIRNSWGPFFGVNGHCWFSADYITWNKTDDLFVPTRMPDFVL